MEAGLNDIKAAVYKEYSIAEVMAMNPLALAYVGDGIFSNFVRLYLIGNGHQNVHFMTKASTRYVRAEAQSIIIHALLDQLTEDELRIVKRGRNTRSQAPKNAKPGDYRYATGFEALVGYLYLIGSQERLDWLCLKGISLIDGSKEKSQ
ncbi:ribonuclease III domain-containing protein [Eubacteriaceae bacterium ES2]|nr:ribonuclease III domain-containing protein [Eubacteriaceae bacterium ES2]